MTRVLRDLVQRVRRRRAENTPRPADAGFHTFRETNVDCGHGLIERGGVDRDITDRRRLEEEMSQLEARNAAILRGVPDLMFVLTRDGTYVDYHARDPELLFAPPESFIGKSVRDVMPPAVADAVMKALEPAGTQRDPVVVEYELPMDPPRYFEARLLRA